MASTSTLPIDVVQSEEAMRAEFALDVRTGLSARCKHLPSKWLYDGRGSRLFEAITQLPEYYPTRTESAILAGAAAAIASSTGAETLVELGSGTSTKTRLLIEALHREGTLRRFQAFDVSEETMRSALAVLGEDYPCIEMAGVVADFETHLDHIPQLPGRLIAFLGSTVGNLDRDGRQRFLAQVGTLLRPGEHLLLGVDLVKDPARLVAAYDDPGRVTEAFEKNALAVVNRAFGAAFDEELFAYRAAWSEIEERVEMGLVSRGAQRVSLPGLGLTVSLDDGEEIRTEISTKFRVADLGEELAGAGLPVVGSWCDPAGDFAVLLAARSDR